MLRRTFTHLDGIGSTKEALLWAQGVKTWKDLDEQSARMFRGSRLRALRRQIARSFDAYDSKDFHFFYESLPSCDLWRLIPGNESRTAFLDIETTGLAPYPMSRVTTISVLLNGKLMQAHTEQGKKRLVELLEESNVILVTYFGSGFDIPFLRKAYRLRLQKAHIDLCFLLRRFGYRGGLKKVESCLTAKSRKQSTGITGAYAPLLWSKYESGDRQALDALLAYNGEDTLVLQSLLKTALDLSKQENGDELPFTTCFKPLPKLTKRVTNRIKATLRETL